MHVTDGLLDALRVLDLSDGDTDAVTRLFADLGADVLKLEPPGGNDIPPRPWRHQL
jgi:crotonobetainyl-CoA:carnitine CoA-transferase CaiB-like acyl-CoA transferase